MQFNKNIPITRKSSSKKKAINFFLIALALFFALFFLSKINFPAPGQEIKKNITNEIIKLK